MNPIRLALCAAMWCLPLTCGAQHPGAPADVPSKADLAGITERGRLLAEYDAAAWHATDAVAALKPDRALLGRYIARKTGKGWVVAFGRLSPAGDKFLIGLEATQTGGTDQYSVQQFAPSKEDTTVYLPGVKAMATALAAFKGARRPYNIAVLPAPGSRLWVYLLPAQTEANIWPLGGDVRYLISRDGSKILETHRMHNTILEYRTPTDGSKPAAGYHSGVLDNRPEDSDVFYVLTRQPAMPELVVTRTLVYTIATDGSITFTDKKKAP